MRLCSGPALVLLVSALNNLVHAHRAKSILSCKRLQVNPSEKLSFRRAYAELLREDSLYRGIVRVMPRLISEKLFDGANTSQKLFGQRLSIDRPLSVIGSYLSNFFPCKYGSVYCLWIPVVAALSAFSNHVVNVIGRSAKKQVIRTNARRVVALVADHKISREFPICQSIRHAMCGFLPIASTSKADLSVSAFYFYASPNPAAFGFANLWPEPVREWLAFTRLHSGCVYNVSRDVNLSGNIA